MSNIQKRKVALIGSGMVGASFLYAAANRGIAECYGIIDINAELARGNMMDLEDASATNFVPWETEAIAYKDLKDYDVVVITAGRPQKPGETRLEMVSDNAKIMKDIALQVKESKFDGITIIASNPVDVLSLVYQKITGFAANKVIGSGTSLDSARLRVELSKVIDVAPQSISAYVLGEHGDSSVSVFSSASVAGKPLSHFLTAKKVTAKKLAEIHKSVYRKAYEIIERKRATFYGIGSALAELVSDVLFDTKQVRACGAKLTGQYGQKDLYIGTAAVIGAKGIESIVEIDMNAEEKKQFTESATVLKKTILAALKAAGLK